MNGFRELISEDDNGKVSCARVCALLLLPPLYASIWLKCDAGVVSALVVGGIGALVARKRTP